MLDLPRRSRLTSWLALAVAAALPLSAQQYEVTDLGSLIDGGWSSASGINNLGHVCGTAEWYAPTGVQAWHACWWDGQTLHDIEPILPELGWGLDLNDSDVVVGYSWSSDGLHAFRWQDHLTTDVHVGSLSFSRAVAINGAGDIVGIYALRVAGVPVAPYQAYARRGDHWFNPGTLGGDDASATDVNERAQFVGAAADASGVLRAYLWDRGVMTDLGDLGGGEFAKASCLNDRAQVGGWSRTTTGDLRAFRWDQGVMIDLGTLGGPNSFARDVNGAGDVVGKSVTAAGDDHAFVWEGGGMLDLNDLIPPASGWELRNAGGINALGQIAGTGLHAGEQRGFLLTPITTGPRLGTPVPGIAGRASTLHAINARPGATLLFVAGTQPGSTPVPGCSGLVVDIADPLLLGSAVADGDGRSLLDTFVPAGFAGRTLYLQVVDVAHCEISELIVYSIP